MTGYAQTSLGRVATRLEGVGAEWTIVCLYSSQAYMDTLVERHPALEFRHPQYGHIEARRR